MSHVQRKSTQECPHVNMMTTRKGFRLKFCFNQTECDKQTIQTQKTWCCTQKGGGGGLGGGKGGRGGGGQRGDAYSRTASGRGPIFKKRHFTLEDAVLGEGVCVCVWLRGGTRREVGGGLPFQKNSGGGSSPEPQKIWRQIPAVAVRSLDLRVQDLQR